MMNKTFLFLLVFPFSISLQNANCIDPIGIESPYFEKLIYHKIDKDTGTLSAPILVLENNESKILGSMSDSGNTIANQDGVIEENDGKFEFTSYTSQRFREHNFLIKNSIDTIIKYPITSSDGSMLLFDNYLYDHNSLTIFDLKNNIVVNELLDADLRRRPNLDKRRYFYNLTASSDFSMISIIYKNDTSYFNCCYSGIRYFYTFINNVFEQEWFNAVDHNYVEQLNDSGDRLFTRFGWYEKGFDKRWTNFRDIKIQTENTEVRATINDIANDGNTLLIGDTIDKLYIAHENETGNFDLEYFDPGYPKGTYGVTRNGQISNDGRVILIGVGLYPGSRYGASVVYIKSDQDIWNKHILNLGDVACFATLTKDGNRIFWTPQVILSVEDYLLHKY